MVKKNPDIYPTFAEQYTSETVQNNSLVVECGDRSRFIGYNDIYLMEANMNEYSYDTSFDGEGAITSAIDYVVNEEQPKIYLLEGHGETELPEIFREQMEKENMELETFSLLTADAIPEDADAILIYGPSSDISEEEKELLEEYVSGGGKLMVMAGPTEKGMLTNLYGILEGYGVETVDGIVVDTDGALCISDAFCAAAGSEKQQDHGSFDRGKVFRDHACCPGSDGSGWGTCDGTAYHF